MYMTNHAKERWEQRFGGGEIGHVIRRSVRIGHTAGADVRYYAPLKCILVCRGNAILTVIRYDDASKYRVLVRRYHYQVEQSQLSQCLDFLRVLKSSL